MVNKSDGCFAAIHGDTAHHMVRIIPVIDIHKRIPINNGKIFHVETIDSVDVSHNLVVGFL